MTDRKSPLASFLMVTAAAMTVTGGLAVLVLAGLAALFPVEDGSITRELRNGAGLVVALILGLRFGRWLDRRWSRE